ncbi:glycogen/starch/alpha-glucan phosphorylase [Roseospira marina]|uniref:Alpha-1,4 glucan phosphorylase n=1 Tax=Roseospira marina TaxID=140057 RepID=A0A5M6IGK4_9PROT|nr:glycogen/starch/alpha-glucan phosphorylase [Roseospira marina]KAA5607403.1 glycogen/starch/alpha-glucan phosphorylase [Roseospira marina]MBB4312424.1 starch phosphorylase [Roseospira marina]MBB5085560.1 starch phosphorylase [Roseospira marina]
MDHLVKEALEGEFRVNLHDADSIRRGLISYMVRVVGHDPLAAGPRQWFQALAHMLKGILSERGMGTSRAQYGQDTRRVYYLSMEFLTGRRLKKHLLDFGLEENVREALASLGQDLDVLAKEEADPALGNGGLGRLAACFLDSMATHRYPGHGYGIHYEFGMFSQTIEDGQQVEHPDSWLHGGNPWEFLRHSVTYPVRFNGRIVCFKDEKGHERCEWVDTNDVHAVAHDMKITGFDSPAISNLRLWAARATNDFDLRFFNEGNYIEAVKDKTTSETLSKVLYPMDSTVLGQELRLKQEYFFVSASLQDIIARHLRVHNDLHNFHEKIAIQLNDTHPALAVPELMRLLMDVHEMEWDEAWAITRETFCYTNHTLLPEALETWPVGMLEHVLPRHLEIIYLINHDHLQQVRFRFPGEMEVLRKMSLVDEDTQRIRMAHLAIVGSKRVNGVAALHTKLLREKVFPEFDAMYPNRFVNVTNGVTQRRWLLQCNPKLSDLISEAIGDSWKTDLTALHALEPLAEDAAFRERFNAIKLANKERLARHLETRTGFTLDPTSMFDVQVKRIHEYKRQLLNLLHVIHRYVQLREGRIANPVPRTVVIGGKAAPGYYLAKQIIRLIGDVALTINNDRAVNDTLKLVFLPNYNVSNAEITIPGANLSEQISTAGTEASGTGNMKFALNGALTIGTLDGANIEIKEEVGDDNIFIFGLTTEQVQETKRKGYNPWKVVEHDADLRRVVDMISSGYFNPQQVNRYNSIRDTLFDGGDQYMVLADFRAYVEAQAHVDDLFTDSDAWARKAILNVARMGLFSSDRSIHTYARDIWGAKQMDL